MAFKIIILMVGLLTLAHCYVEEDGVLILKDQDLANITTLFPNIFIKYYVPWCRHCQQLAPILSQIAKELQSQDHQIKIAKINVEQNEGVHQFQEVQHFPTLVFYQNGKKEVFVGDRTKDYLVKWLKKRVFSPVSQISKEKIQILRNAQQSDVSVIFHGPPQGQKYSAFVDFASVDNYNNYHYIKQTQKPSGTIQLLRSFAIDLETSFQDETFQAWLNNHDRHHVVPLDQRSISSIFRDGTLGILLFLQDKFENKSSQFSQAASTWKETNIDNQGNKILFVKVSEEHEDYHGLLEFMDLNPNESPVVIVDAAKELKYVLEVQVGNLTSSDIIAFLDSFGEGKIVSSALQSQHSKQQQEQKNHHHHHHHDHDHEHDHHYHHDHQHHGHDHDHDHSHHDHNHDHHHHHHHKHNHHHKNAKKAHTHKKAQQKEANTHKQIENTEL